MRSTMQPHSPSKGMPNTSLMVACLLMIVVVFCAFALVGHAGSKRHGTEYYPSTARYSAAPNKSTLPAFGSQKQVASSCVGSQCHRMLGKKKKGGHHEEDYEEKQVVLEVVEEVVVPGPVKTHEIPHKKHGYPSMSYAPYDSFMPEKYHPAVMEWHDMHHEKMPMHHKKQPMMHHKEPIVHHKKMPMMHHKKEPIMHHKKEPVVHHKKMPMPHHKKYHECIGKACYRALGKKKKLLEEGIPPPPIVIKLPAHPPIKSTAAEGHYHIPHGDYGPISHNVHPGVGYGPYHNAATHGVHGTDHGHHHIAGGYGANIGKRNSGGYTSSDFGSHTYKEPVQGGYSSRQNYGKPQVYSESEKSSFNKPLKGYDGLQRLHSKKPQKGYGEPYVEYTEASKPTYREPQNKFTSTKYEKPQKGYGEPYAEYTEASKPTYPEPQNEFTSTKYEKPQREYQEARYDDPSKVSSDMEYENGHEYSQSNINKHSKGYNEQYQTNGKRYGVPKNDKTPSRGYGEKGREGLQKGYSEARDEKVQIEYRDSGYGKPSKSFSESKYGKHQPSNNYATPKMFQEPTFSKDYKESQEKSFEQKPWEGHVRMLGKKKKHEEVPPPKKESVNYAHAAYPAEGLHQLTPGVDVHGLNGVGHMPAVFIQQHPYDEQHLYMHEDTLGHGPAPHHQPQHASHNLHEYEGTLGHGPAALHHHPQHASHNLHEYGYPSPDQHFSGEYSYPPPGPYFAKGKGIPYTPPPVPAKYNYPVPGPYVPPEGKEAPRSPIKQQYDGSLGRYVGVEHSACKGQKCFRRLKKEEVLYDPELTYYYPPETQSFPSKTHPDPARHKEELVVRALPPPPPCRGKGCKRLLGKKKKQMEEASKELPVGKNVVHTGHVEHVVHIDSVLPPSKKMYPLPPPAVPTAKEGYHSAPPPMHGYPPPGFFHEGSYPNHEESFNHEGPYHHHEALPTSAAYPHHHHSYPPAYHPPPPHKYPEMPPKFHVSAPEYQHPPPLHYSSHEYKGAEPWVPQPSKEKGKYVPMCSKGTKGCLAP